MKIILLGPQGSGKGTQGKLLSKKLGIPHISTGDVLREMARSDSALGNKVRLMMDEGLLIDDELLEKIISSRISRDDCKEGFILDGTPRDLHQARVIDEMAQFDAVILINISEDESFRRVHKRRKLEHRHDDTDEALKKRLKLYHQKTEEVIDHYRKKGLLITVDGERSVEEVFDEIISCLKKARLLDKQ